MGTPTRVLVVDNNPEGREALCAVLGVEGYRVLSAATGAEALALLPVGMFDALVLDLGLPDVDGLEIVRTAAARPEPPFILVFTGYHRLQADAEAAGCNAFILQPRIDDLLARLRLFMTERSLRRARQKQKKAEGE